MNSTALFDAFTTQDPGGKGVNGAGTSAQATGEPAAVETPFVSEQTKPPSDRNITKWCRENSQYDPNQPLKGNDRTFGQPLNDNPFIKCFESRLSPREKTLGDLNRRVTEYNDTKPIGVITLTASEQQKLFTNNATSAIKPLLLINPNTVTQFKAESYHLHNFCHVGMMWVSRDIIYQAT